MRRRFVNPKASLLKLFYPNTQNAGERVIKHPHLRGLGRGAVSSSGMLDLFKALLCLKYACTVCISFHDISRVAEMKSAFSVFHS